jgi:hypothetical protein
MPEPPLLRDQQLQSFKDALSDVYTVLGQVGEGSMGIVFEARDLKHDRHVAIKILRPEIATSLGTDRFLREIRIEAGLNHPHILPVYDSGEAAASQTAAVTAAAASWAPAPRVARSIRGSVRSAATTTAAANGSPTMANAEAAGRLGGARGRPR